MSDIFDEVSEELRTDQAVKLLRSYAGVFIAILFAVLVGVFGYEYWLDQQKQAAFFEAARYLNSFPKILNKEGTDLVPAPLTDADIANLRAIAGNGSMGYRTLARLHVADIDWQHHDAAGALATLKSVYDDPAVPQTLRDVATLVSVQRQIDSGDPAVLRTQLQPLLIGDATTHAAPWRPFAELAMALLDLRTNQPDHAIKIMRSLLTDPTTPPGIARLAGYVLQSLGVNPDDNQEHKG